MTDIVERLRGTKSEPSAFAPSGFARRAASDMEREAADEIEGLRAEVSTCRELLRRWSAMLHDRAWGDGYLRSPDPSALLALTDAALDRARARRPHGLD